MVVNEIQSFRGSWIIYILLMIKVPILVLLTVFWLIGEKGDYGLLPLLLVLLIMGLALALILNMELKTKLDAQSFTFTCAPFFRHPKTFKKEEVKKISLKRMNGLLEYGGIGIRFKRGVQAYVFSTDYVIEIEIGKRKFVFSTERPHDVHSLLEDWDNYQSKIY